MQVGVRMASFMPCRSFLSAGQMVARETAGQASNLDSQEQRSVGFCHAAPLPDSPLCQKMLPDPISHLLKNLALVGNLLLFFMKKFTYLFFMLVASACIYAQQSQQSAVQILQQKALADQMPIATAPAEFRTPLKTFETYFAGTLARDASEYRSWTANALKALFDEEILNEASLAAIRSGRQELDERDYSLFEFRYSHDVNRPMITIGYSYTYKAASGLRVQTGARERLSFIRTGGGWKIDLMETNPTQ